MQAGGHWCICAWAFASAVERDPTNLQGIELDCERTNAKLRHVYQHFIDEGKKLTSPSGASYEASTALAHPTGATATAVVDCHTLRFPAPSARWARYQGRHGVETSTDTRVEESSRRRPRHDDASNAAWQQRRHDGTLSSLLHECLLGVRVVVVWCFRRRRSLWWTT